MFHVYSTDGTKKMILKINIKIYGDDSRSTKVKYIVDSTPAHRTAFPTETLKLLIILKLLQNQTALKNTSKTYSECHLEIHVGQKV